MVYAKLKRKVIVDDYLAFEEISSLRHEYRYGDLWPVADVGDDHNIIAENLFALLRHHLCDSSYRPFIQNMKVRADAEVFYHPDVMVTSDEPQVSNYFRSSPTLLIEVISTWSRREERCEKVAAYRLMPSVKEIVFVDQRKAFVEVQRRCPDGHWLTYSYDGLPDVIELKSVEMSISVQEIYRRVNFDAESGEEPNLP